MGKTKQPTAAEVKRLVALAKKLDKDDDTPGPGFLFGLPSPEETQ